MGTQLSLSQRGTASQFPAHICCGQMAGWIKMPFGTEVGLGSVDIVLDNAPPKRGTALHKFSADVYCGQTLGWIKMPHAHWYEGRPRPRRHCVRWGPTLAAPPKGARPPIFIPCLLWPNGRPSQLLLSSCLHFA